MNAKPLTIEQKEIFKTLYLQGYSASLIFENLGFPYNVNDSHKYNQRMRYYRVKLKLPIRGIGSKPQISRHHVANKILKREKRIEQIRLSLLHWETKIKDLKQELSQLIQQ
jgi:hypothetical protein